MPKDIIRQKFHARRVLTTNLPRASDRSLALAGDAKRDQEAFFYSLFRAQKRTMLEFSP